MYPPVLITGDVVDFKLNPLCIEDASLFNLNVSYGVDSPEEIKATVMQVNDVFEVQYEDIQPTFIYKISIVLYYNGMEVQRCENSSVSG